MRNTKYTQLDIAVDNFIVFEEEKYKNLAICELNILKRQKNISSYKIIQTKKLLNIK